MPASNYKRRQADSGTKLNLTNKTLLRAVLKLVLHLNLHVY
jgi:hypothetical protein